MSSSTSRTKGTPHITIIGNGAIGSLLALGCHNENRAFTLLTRAGTSLQLHGIDLNGNATVFSPRVAGPDESISEGIIVFPLKAYQIIPAIKQLKDMITHRHTVILLHNGMGTLTDAQALLEGIPLLAATTSYGALKISADTVKATGTGHTHCGWVNNPLADNGEDVRDFLSALLPPCQWHHDINKPLWNKLAINAVINPLTAIHDIPNGELAHRRFEGEISQLCSETAAVMSACGYSTSGEALVSQCYQVINGTAANFSSMHQDVKHLRRTEIDFISGYLVAQGHKLGLSVPRHQAMLDSIKAMECL